uniref:Uncharacterized protein n=2 Tax=Parasteatoda tepidariorum TaxID=114398 RepID=A0A2L2YE88_PARTP
MEYKSDSDQEIVEISNAKPTNGKIKQETPAKTETDEEPTEGRRPSRRAAREAAKKIYNTVRSFMPKAEDAVYTPPSSSPITFSKYNSISRTKRRPSLKAAQIEIDLVMECHEEILSPVQAEALLKSQLEYNMVMKTLRSLKASNAKIIFAKEPYSAGVPTTTAAPTVPSASVVPLKLANNPAIQITKTTLPA